MEPQYVWAKADYRVFLGKPTRLTKGHRYAVERIDDLGRLWIRACDQGHNCCWGEDWREHFTDVEPLRLEPPAYQPLDDAGRAALKAGDEVLVRMTIRDPEVDDGGDLGVYMNYASGRQTHWAKPADVFALLPKAPEPIAVGDKLRSTLSADVPRVDYTCVGFTSDGKVVAEYAAGDETNVMSRDASCWEKVS